MLNKTVYNRSSQMYTTVINNKVGREVGRGYAPTAKASQKMAKMEVQGKLQDREVKVSI
jgi:hypothetical protein